MLNIVLIFVFFCSLSLSQQTTDIKKIKNK